MGSIYRPDDQGLDMSTNRVLSTEEVEFYQRVFRNTMLTLIESALDKLIEQHKPQTNADGEEVSSPATPMICENEEGQAADSSTPPTIIQNNEQEKDATTASASRRQLFPEKLWDLVNEPGSGIKWSPEGTKIEVERSKLEKFISRKFRSQNFNSFIRQLHFYGFKKCGNSYYHESFQRGHPENLPFMKRKYSSRALTKITPYDELHLNVK